MDAADHTLEVPFQHERLEVYSHAMTLLELVQVMASRLPRTQAASRLSDQLVRAAYSIPLNLAEGSAEYSPLEKIRFYRYSVRSAGELASILDIIARLHPLNAKLAAEAKSHLHRVTGMTLGLIRHQESRRG